MPHDVFISHSSKDKAAAVAVCAALEARGIACWMAPRNVRPGTSYAAEIIGAISDAKVMLLLHSHASNESPEVHREIERAGAKRIAIVSLRLEVCEMSRELEYFLSSVQWIDATTPPLEDHLGPLVEAVHALLVQRGSQPRSPASIAPRSSAPRRSLARFSVLAPMVFAIVALGAWWILRPHPVLNPDGNNSLAKSTPATHHGVPVTAHPPPKTNNPEAAAAYASALQNYRDGSMALSGQDFQKAVTLDPSFAAANLRLSLRWISLHWGMDTLHREQFAAVSQFRSALDERDTLLLAAADAFTAVPSDFDAIVSRMRQAADKYPDDAEVAFLMGSAFDRTGHGAEARVAYHRAFELDPQFAGALWGESITHYEIGDQEGTTKLLQQCLDVAPMGASCARTLAVVSEQRGHCDEMESYVRRIISIEPGGSYSHWWVARSLAVHGAPIESIKAALDKAAELGGVGTGFVLPPKRVAEAMLAVLTGDLSKAETAAREMEHEIEGNQSESIHGQVTTLLMSIAEERGDTQEALRLAEAFVKEVPAWTPNDPGHVRTWRLFLLHQAGKLADGPFEEQLERLRKEALAMMPPVVPKIILDDLWDEFDATHVQTRAEAEQALAHVPAGRTSTLYGIRQLVPGRINLLAGKIDAAIPLLREAAGSCSIFPSTNVPAEPTTIEFLRASLLLGQALEQKGDSTGACGAFARVLARWPHPVPRSITVDAARAGAKRLKCGN